MISMLDTVENALRNDTELNNLVNGRVYWVNSPTKTTPYVTFLEVNNSEVESADDEEYADDIEIQVDIWRKGKTDIIAKEVVRVMRALGFTHDAQPDMYEKETQIHHKPIRFEITKEV